MANVLAILVLIHTCRRIRRSAPSDKEATRSEISLAAVMRMINGHVVVEKDAEKAKVKASKAPEASLQVQEAAMLLQLRLLFTN